MSAVKRVSGRKIASGLRYVLYFLLGVGVFWLIYKDVDKQIVNELKGLDYEWLIISVIAGLLSHFIRAFRWKMLIQPLGYSPKTSNTFLAILVMYMTNLIIPRGGEFARCGVMTKYEKIPFPKLIGTVVIDRLTDLIALAIFGLVIVVVEFEVFIQFFRSHPEIQQHVMNVLTWRNGMIAIAGLSFGIIVLYYYRNRLRSSRLYTKLKELTDNVVKGVKTIKQLRHSWLYILYTILIFFAWLIMFYVVFFSYAPTDHLSFFAGWAAFVMSAFAMIVPIQAGIGPWHFMVYETLFIYGIEKSNGKIFALVSHSVTNLSLLLAGLIALVLLPVLNTALQKTDNP